MIKKYNEIEQRSPEWFQKKKGVISSTTLRGIMGTPNARKEMFYEKIAERLMVGVDDYMDYQNPMERGSEMEGEAIAMFEFTTGLSVEKVGFVENEDEQFIGYSPDGIIKDTNDEEDLEIKCPMGKEFVRTWLENAPKKDYYWQIVHAFCVNDKLKKRYFVNYHPNIEIHKLHIIEVTREELSEDIERAKQAQLVFIQEVEEQLKKIIAL